jgi:CMP-N,N'-diacetyllegionaminic acid synthase
MKIIGFVPARSGSTRLKNKNIKLVNGRPLIYWTIVKALSSKKFDKLIFSSDSENYFKILLKFLRKDKINHKILDFDLRNAVHSKTKSKIFDYLKHDFIKKYQCKDDSLIVQMLPTCPMRTKTTIINSIKLAISSGKNTFTVCSYDFHVSFALSIEKNGWKALFKNKSPLVSGNTQSQSQKKYYHPNGSVNCLHVKKLSKKAKSIYLDALPVLISRKESLDIDTKEDFEFLKNTFFNKKFI